MGKIITGMGAAGFTYEEMAKRIALNMGGFGYNLSAGFTAQGDASWSKMIFLSNLFTAIFRKPLRLSAM